MGIGNDSISSVKVPAGLKVTMYENHVGSGRRVVLTSDTPFLTGTLNFDNMASSIKIELN